MKKISIFILFLIGINCKILPLRDEKFLSNRASLNNSKISNKKNNKKDYKYEYEDIGIYNHNDIEIENEMMKNLPEINISSEIYYELVIADFIIELIETNYNYSINNNNIYDNIICIDSFNKLNEAIELTTNFCEKIIKNIINRNLPSHYKLLLSQEIYNSLPLTITIKKDGPLGPNGDYKVEGDYGTKGNKGPFGPHGPKGPRHYHHHKHSKYGKFGKIYSKEIAKKNKPNKDKKDVQMMHRRLVDPLIDRSAICEYIFGFFGFDVKQCYD
jgi:hypothetical protein